MRVDLVPKIKNITEKKNMSGETEAVQQSK